jgi:hypothetical protein
MGRSGRFCVGWGSINRNGIRTTIASDGTAIIATLLSRGAKTVNDPYYNLIEGYVPDVRPVYSRETMSQMEQYLTNARADANKWADRAGKCQCDYLKLHDWYFLLKMAFYGSLAANAVLISWLIASLKK